MKMDLTVVMVVYNEKSTVLRAFEEARLIGVNNKEIIIVDNFSTDGTKELLQTIKDPGITIVFQNKNYGVGKSVETGIKLANGKYVYIHHADMEYDGKTAEVMYKLADKDNLDAVFGSRIKDLNMHPAKLIFRRPEYIATLISSFLVNLWYGYKFTDVIGSKLYRTESVRKVPVTTYGCGFEFEHVSRMCKRHFNIAEIHAPYKPRENRKEKKIKPYHMLNAFISLFRVKIFG